MTRLLTLLALATLCGCGDTHEWIPWSACTSSISHKNFMPALAL